MRTSPSDEVRLSLVARKDVVAGVLFAVVGAGSATMAAGYGVGTVGAMGAGFFPFCLGVIAIGLGAISIVRGVRDPSGGALDAAGLRSLLLILAGTMAFALLIERAGLVAAIVALVALACVASPHRRVLEIALIALVLSAFSVGLFIYAFGMPLHAF